MFENALALRNIDAKRRVTYKTLVSAGLVALAVVLPQLVHLALGQPGGVKWLPMYLPVLIGGCLLGTKWGLTVGILSPLASFLVTSLMGNAMPAAARLPFMVFELAVFAAVSGLFSKKISENGLWAFPAVICAQLAGRLLFLGSVFLFGAFVPFTAGMIMDQIRTGLIGLLVQAALVPLMILGLRALLIKDNKSE